MCDSFRPCTDGSYVVVDIVRDGGAHRSGVDIGDVMVAVAGRLATTLSTSQLVELIKGAPRSQVEMVLESTRREDGSRFDAGALMPANRSPSVVSPQPLRASSPAGSPAASAASGGDGAWGEGKNLEAGSRMRTSLSSTDAPMTQMVSPNSLSLTTAPRSAPPMPNSPTPTSSTSPTNSDPHPPATPQDAVGAKGPFRPPALTMHPSLRDLLERHIVSEAIVSETKTFSPASSLLQIQDEERHLGHSPSNSPTRALPSTEPWSPTSVCEADASRASARPSGPSNLVPKLGGKVEEGAVAQGYTPVQRAQPALEVRAAQRAAPPRAPLSGAESDSIAHDGAARAGTESSQPLSESDKPVRSPSGSVQVDVCVHDRRLCDTKVEQRILRVSSNASVLKKVLETSTLETSTVESSRLESSKLETSNLESSNLDDNNQIEHDPNTTGGAMEMGQLAIGQLEMGQLAIAHCWQCASGLEQADTELARLASVLDIVARGVAWQEGKVQQARVEVQEATRAYLSLRSIAAQLQVQNMFSKLFDSSCTCCCVSLVAASSKDVLLRHEKDPHSYYYQARLACLMFLIFEKLCSLKTRCWQRRKKRWRSSCKAANEACRF